MNPVLARLLESGSVTGGTAAYRLHSNMQPEEGELIQRVIATVKPSTTLETGMAYGIFSLNVCDALSKLLGPARHIAIDSSQLADWHGIGRFNVQQAGFEEMIQIIEQGSEIAQPRLLADAG